MARNPNASYEASDHQRMPIVPISSLYVNKGNVFIWNDHDGKNVTTINIRVPFRAYRCMSGFVYTRYGICAFVINHGSVISAATISVNKIIGVETFTTSISNDVFSIISNMGWNSFMVEGFCNGSGFSPSEVTASVS